MLDVIENYREVITDVLALHATYYGLNKFDIARCCYVGYTP